MADFIYFTEEQKERVREIDLVSYLKKNGYQLKRAGSDYIWESSQGKVSIKGNKWYHQYDKRSDGEEANHRNILRIYIRGV